MGSSSNIFKDNVLKDVLLLESSDKDDESLLRSLNKAVADYMVFEHTSGNVLYLAFHSGIDVHIFKYDEYYSLLSDHPIYHNNEDSSSKMSIDRVAFYLRKICNMT